MPFGVSGTRFVFHDEWRYNFNAGRRRWSGTWGPTPSSRLNQADSNKVRYYAYTTPIFGSFFKSVAQWDELDDYMAEHGLDWETIDPLKASDKFGNTPVSTLGSTLKMSKNILKLYE